MASPARRQYYLATSAHGTRVVLLWHSTSFKQKHMAETPFHLCLIEDDLKARYVADIHWKIQLGLLDKETTYELLLEYGRDLQLRERDLGMEINEAFELVARFGTHPNKKYWRTWCERLNVLRLQSILMSVEKSAYDCVFLRTTDVV